MCVCVFQPVSSLFLCNHVASCQPLKCAETLPPAGTNTNSTFSYFGIYLDFAAFGALRHVVEGIRKQHPQNNKKLKTEKQD